MDLFSAPQPDTYEQTQEEVWRDAMQKQWQRDKERVKQRRIIPDWEGEPKPLSRDRARILELLYDVGCFEWTGNPSKNNERVASVIKQPIANVKGLLKLMEQEGLIASRMYRGKQVWEMLQAGEYALEDFWLDQEMGFL